MKQRCFAALAGLTLLASTSVALAGSQWVRVGWQGNASKEATISFTPSGSNNNPYISYGYTTNESSWSTRPVTFTTSMASITHKHIRLSGLNPDSPVYFRVCDNNGCGDRYWFRTAPNNNSPFVVVAGGDTRSGWTNRQDGNRLVAKIRPLFVMHGGDFTNSNNYSEWRQWLIDWELSYSSDNINGYDYKRVYPMISTHGNHEDSDISTICRVFGVDATRNNSCSANDTYYSVDVSPLLRVYTLNSQFQGESSSLRNAQNNWLANDLASNGSDSTWRFAQYHKPMFPHYTGKSDNRTLFDWWAQLFYDYSMNVVVESDTHMTKLTDVVVPSGNNFSVASSGTVYVGEGSWGAPARSANDPKSYTLDLASIQQFKVITVSNDGLDLRTAQFNSSASTLSRTQRNNNPTVLPNNVSWWSANGVGEVLALGQDAAMRSVRAGSSPGGGDDQVRLSATHDTFISSANRNTNYDGSNDQLLADGDDGDYGEMQSLIKWDLSSVPSCATIETASVEINVFNASSDRYAIFAGAGNWSETNATWNSVGGYSQQADRLASFSPGFEGLNRITLNSAGVVAVQSWLSGGNYGIVIADDGATDGIDFNDRETGPAPVLALTYNEDSCDGDGDGGGSDDPSDSVIEASHDTFISSANQNTNYDNSADQLLADGSDSEYGETMSLLKWDLSSVPTCATVEQASVEINVFNPSDGAYAFYLGNNSWLENTATWQLVNGYGQRGNQVAEFTPTANRAYQITLNSTGVSAVQNWIEARDNYGLVVASTGTSNGVDFNDQENGPAPKLLLNWNDNDCGGSSSTADLAVTLVETDKWDEQSRSYTIEATITNDGPSTAEDVVVSLSYPANPDLTVVSTLTTAGSCATDATRCNLGDMESNEQVSIIVRLQKPTQGSELHVVMVSAETDDQNQSNNRQSGNFGGALHWLLLLALGLLVLRRVR